MVVSPCATPDLTRQLSPPLARPGQLIQQLCPIEIDYREESDFSHACCSKTECSVPSSEELMLAHFMYAPVAT